MMNLILIALAFGNWCYSCWLRKKITADLCHEFRTSGWYINRLFEDALYIMEHRDEILAQDRRGPYQFKYPEDEKPEC